MAAATEPQGAETPDIQEGARLLCVFAQERPDITRRQAIDRLANRRGWGRAAAAGALEESIRHELVHEADVPHVGLRASTRRVLRPGPAPRAGRQEELSAADLDCLLERADASERWLAEQLVACGVRAKQPTVSGWRRGRRRIPPAYQDLIRQLLRGRAGEQLKARRKRAGLSQPQVGAVFDRGGATVSFWERFPDRVPDDQWAPLLDAIGESPREDPGPGVDVGELERMLAATELPKKALARELGVAPCQVYDWLRARRPVPDRYWQRIRELEHAPPEPAAVLDHVRDRVLPDLDQLVSDIPGVTETYARRHLEYGHESLWRAWKLGLQSERFHRRRVRREVAPGRMRSVLGYFAGPTPADLPEHEHPSAKPEVSALPAALDLVRDSPGIDVKRLREELRVEPKVARDVAALAVARGLARWGDLDYTDSLGRPRGGRRPRRGLYPQTR